MKVWFTETLCVLDWFTLGRYVHDDIAHTAKSKTKMGLNNKNICLQKKANLLCPAQFLLANICFFLHNKD